MFNHLLENIYIPTGYEQSAYNKLYKRWKRERGEVYDEGEIVKITDDEEEPGLLYNVYMIKYWPVYKNKKTGEPIKGAKTYSNYRMTLNQIKAWTKL